MSEWVCGTGGWSGPKPGDPDNNLVLSARPAFGGIDVSWTYPGINAHAVAHTILYRSTSGNEATKVQHSIVSGNFFYDKSSSDSSIEYFYWIQIVTVNGTIGELIGPASATARPTIEQTIEQLTGKIDAGVLAQSLKEDIGKIVILNENLLEEVRNRTLGDDSLGETFNELQNEFDDVKTLVLQEIQERSDADSAFVSMANTLYTNLDNVGAMLRQEEVARATKDEALVRNIQELYTETGENKAAIASEAQARTTSVSALTQQMELMLAETNENTNAAILAERTARTSRDEALAQDITNLYTEMGTGFTDAAAALLEEQKARVTVEEATAKDMLSLAARVGENESFLTEESSVRASADSALSRTISSIVARLDATPVWVSNFESGTDLDRWKAKPGATIKGIPQGYSGQAALISYLGPVPVLTGSTGGVSAQITESLVLNYAGKRVRVTGYAKRPSLNFSNEFAVAMVTSKGNSGWQKFTAPAEWSLFEFLWDVPEGLDGIGYLSFWGDTNNAGSGVLIDMITIQPATSEEDLPAIFAAVQDEANARIAQDSALAAQINTVQTEYGSNLASVQTSLSSQINTVNGKVTNIGALYTAKVGVNGLIGGFGVYNDGKEVLAGFDVNTFFVGRSGVNNRKPFIVQNGEVFIDDAAINKLTFNKLRDESGAFVVQNGKVKANYLSVGTASITDASITTAKIANAAITSAKIGKAAVDSLQIKGEAVTVPIATTAYWLSSATAWTTICVLYVTVDEPCWLFAMSSGYIGYGSGWGQTDSMLTIDGTEVSGGGGSSSWVSMSHSGAKWVGAGTHVVELRFQSPSRKGTAYSRSLFAMGAQR